MAQFALAHPWLFCGTTLIVAAATWSALIKIAIIKYGSKSVSAKKEKHTV